jgi:hypothetical protein
MTHYRKDKEMRSNQWRLTRFTAQALMLVSLAMGLPIAEAAHIGGQTITKIRHWEGGTALVYVSPGISSLPECATYGNAFMLTGLDDSGFASRRFGMLLAAWASGARVNPNCRATCSTLWFGAVVNCVEVSIE